MNKFDLGETILDGGVQVACELDNVFLEEMTEYFEKYINCDWGALTFKSRLKNNEALIKGGRILGRYLTSRGVLFITTYTYSKKRQTKIMFEPPENRKTYFEMLKMRNKNKYKNKNTFGQQELDLASCAKIKVG